MYCKECGSLIIKDAQYCGECGTYIGDEKPPKKEKIKKVKIYKNKVKKEKKKMSRGKKTVLLILLFLVFLLGSIYFYLRHTTSKEEVAKEYFAAVITNDGDALYKYLDIPEESSFVNQKVFKKIMDRTLGEEEKKKIKEYEVTKSEVSADGNAAYVTISYLQNGEKRSRTILLKKGDRKKYYLFDDWMVTQSPIELAYHFKIHVMKGSILKIEGIEVNKKYLKKELCTETEDVYEIPSLFKLSYQIEAALPLGFTVHAEVNGKNVSGSYTVPIDDVQIPEKFKNQILGKAKENLQNIYDSILEGKSFSDIKSKYEYEKGDLSILEKKYESMKKEIEEGNQVLEKIKFSDVKVEKIQMGEGGLFYVTLKGTYTYTISSQEEKHEGKGTDTMYFTFDYQKDKFYLVDMKSMQTYFSRYS